MQPRDPCPPWLLPSAAWLTALRVKLQYFGHLMQSVDSLEKTLMLGGIWGQEEKGMTEDEIIFSGVVSTELGPSLETQRHRGRQDHMDKPLLFSIALMNLTLSGSF